MNTILGFFTNVLASLVSSALGRIHPLLMIAAGLLLGIWITYMIMRHPDNKKAVKTEGGATVVGDLFADGLEAVSEAVTMAV
jgi:predicted acyltransferase